jgi:hypothetical protein
MSVIPAAVAAIGIGKHSVALLPFVEFMLVRRRAGQRDGRETGRGAEMKQRLWFSLALLAVLFCFWLVMTKPMCREGFVAVLGIRSGWACVVDGT